MNSAVDLLVPYPIGLILQTDSRRGRVGMDGVRHDLQLLRRRLELCTPIQSDGGRRSVQEILEELNQIAIPADTHQWAPERREIRRLKQFIRGHLLIWSATHSRL
jgi:hypothetical protein